MIGQILLPHVYAEALAVLLGALMGVVGYLGVLDTLAARGNVHRLAYALARMGFIVLLAPLLELIIRAPGLGLTWELVAFTVGAVMMIVGYAWIVLLHRRGERVP